MYTVLIHPQFYQALKLSTPELRGRVRKTLQRLRDGHWTGGTRVRRLQGVERPVFEARTDAADRLLFTAIRSASRDEPGRLELHLQVWDLVDHDAVTRSARRIRVADTEFLDFSVLEEHEIHEPPPFPEARFDEISAEGGADDVLLHLLIPPDDFAPPATEGIAGGLRWYRVAPQTLDDEAGFQRLIDEGGSELELKLTRPQYEVLRARGPVMLAGSAGSGKTTIAVHRLGETATRPEQPKALYLSYSHWLVEHAQGLYRDLLVARGLDPRANPPRFTTFADLYRALAPRELHEKAERVVRLPLFEQWFRRTFRRLDPALVWEELRSILKGACLNLGRAMLEKDAYLELGRKRAPLFVGERDEIFAIAGRYQEWLAQEDRIDELDLCREALRRLRHDKTRRYDVVVCDEVQDLTELEVAFVLALYSGQDLAGLFLAGDTQQIVNPSGFRWAEVRQALMRRQERQCGAPEVVSLRQNFRSVRPVVELANALLALRREVFGAFDQDEPEQAVLLGPAPIEVVDEDARVVESIRDFGPRCAVLVPDEAEAEAMRRRLETSRVFQLHEAKGLEFDTVILWKLLAAEPKTVGDFLRGRPDREKDARLKRLLQHLYVAVTRARRHVTVYEGPSPHPFWSQPRFRGRLEREPSGALARLFRQAASPEAWLKEGDYYLARGRFRQAAECYRRGGARTRETEALARFAESLERWEEALGHWEALGRADRQAPLLERLGREEEAIALYREAGRDEDVARCELLLLEKRGQWAEAARRWQEAGRLDQAQRCYRASGDHGKALRLGAEAAEKAKDWRGAGSAWLELREYETAARCYKKAKDVPRASLALARHHEERRDWSAAAAAYARAGEPDRATELRARAHEAAGRLAKAAGEWESLGRKDRALALYRRAGDRRKIAELAPASLTLDDALELEKQGEWRTCAAFAAGRIPPLQQALHRSPWNRVDSRDRQISQELWGWRRLQARCLAHLAEEDGEWRRAAARWSQADDAARARECRLKAIALNPDPRARGRAFVKEGRAEEAIAAFREAGDAEGATEAMARLAEKGRRLEEAAQLWGSLGRRKDEARCLAQLARAASDWTRAARLHTRAGQHTLAKDAERRARTAARRTRRVGLSRQPSLFDDES